MEICPNLRIGLGSGKTDEWEIPTETSRFRQQLRERGYAIVNKNLPSSLTANLRLGIEGLNSHGLPASFILLFDETWELATLSRSLMNRSTSETNQFHYDILAWYIDDKGFSPHRDRQPDDVASSFGPEGDAKFITHWIALTPATTSNSCLYMIPKHVDPGYENGDSDDKDPLRVALPNKDAFQNIRAIPRDVGQSVLFTHRIIHWGSRKDPEAEPRIAISFVSSDPSYEKPYINPSYFTQERLPPFHIRLLLVCAQLLAYYERFDLPVNFLKACFDYCKNHEDELERRFREKVYVEFVNAMKEKNVDGLDDQDEDLLMEEMLAAEEAGYGEFRDDFDDIEGEPHSSDSSVDADSEVQEVVDNSSLHDQVNNIGDSNDDQSHYEKLGAERDLCRAQKRFRAGE